MEYNILQNINSPQDIKKLNTNELDQLSAEIRNYMVKTVSRTGGHLSSNLGVVELSVALHKSFSSPDDKLVWDVGHQIYAHKLLTGRYKNFVTLRQEDGISGFCAPNESEHDTFYSGHSSTSISAALGIAVANKKRGYLNKNNNGEIEIKYIENKSNIYHETQHAIQYEEGKLKIFKDQYFNTPREAKLKNELEAYQIEYIIGNKFNEVYGINNLNDITIEWIITVGY